MIKFNGGNPVIICDNCRTIVRYASNQTRAKELEFCDECLDQKNENDKWISEYEENLEDIFNDN